MRSDNLDGVLLSLKNVSKSFGGKRVLSDVSLSLTRGEVLFLLGPSGCGKTTLLRILAGFENADTGTMQLGDSEVFGGGTFVPPQGRNLGYVVQEGVLFPHMTVYRNIAYGLGNGRGTARADSERIREVMALTEITELADRMPHQISGGQQQRVALARALAPRPPVLLLDEPFSALDEHLRARIRDDIIGIIRRSDAAAVIVTHDRQEALSSADTIGLIHDGRLVQLDSPENLYRYPRSPAIARFICDDCVVLPAQLAGDRQSARSALSDHLPVETKACDSVDTISLQGQLLIRSGQLRLADARCETAAFRARVKRVEFIGSITRIELAVNGIGFRVISATEDIGCGAGDEIGVALSGKALFFDA
jgi:iron(III) transport system ATP-binding protein